MRLGHGQRILLVLHHAVRAGRGGHAGFFGQSAADRFVLQGVHGPGIGADEPDVAALADIGKVGVLGQEAVAGMDGVHIGDFGRADNPVDPQIALVGWAALPMQMASSASWTCMELASTSE